jgi:peroxiredoxin
MAKAYGMWAGEEPYNCTKRGTVVIDENGKISHYEEVPMKDPRTVEALQRSQRQSIGRRWRQQRFEFWADQTA